MPSQSPASPPARAPSHLPTRRPSFALGPPELPADAARVGPLAYVEAPSDELEAASQNGRPAGASSGPAALVSGATVVPQAPRPLGRGGSGRTAASDRQSLRERPHRADLARAAQRRLDGATEQDATAQQGHSHSPSRSGSGSGSDRGRADSQSRRPSVESFNSEGSDKLDLAVAGNGSAAGEQPATGRPAAAAAGSKGVRTASGADAAASVGEPHGQPEAKGGSAEPADLKAARLAAKGSEAEVLAAERSPASNRAQGPTTNEPAADIAPAEQDQAPKAEEAAIGQAQGSQASGKKAEAGGASPPTAPPSASAQATNDNRAAARRVVVGAILSTACIAGGAVVTGGLLLPAFGAANFAAQLGLLTVHLMVRLDGQEKVGLNAEGNRWRGALQMVLTGAELVFWLPALSVVPPLALAKYSLVAIAIGLAPAATVALAPTEGMAGGAMRVSDRIRRTGDRLKLLTFVANVVTLGMVACRYSPFALPVLLASLVAGNVLDLQRVAHEQIQAESAALRKERGAAASYIWWQRGLLFGKGVGRSAYHLHLYVGCAIAATSQAAAVPWPLSLQRANLRPSAAQAGAARSGPTASARPWAGQPNFQAA